LLRILSGLPTLVNGIEIEGMLFEMLAQNMVKHLNPLFNSSNLKSMLKYLLTQL